MSSFYKKSTWKRVLLIVASFCAIPGLFAQFTQYCPPDFPGFADCEFITCVYCNLNGYTGSTAGFGTDPDGDLHNFFCSGSIQDVQYLDFYASATTITFTITLSNCQVITGIDVGVMAGCDQAFNACVLGNGTNTNTVTAFNLIIGNRYILVIDVDASSPCDLSIATNPPNGTVPPGFIIPPVLALQGDFSVCPNATAGYQVVPSNFVADYLWTAPPDALINGQPSPAYIMSGNSVNITFGSTGGQVCATPSNGCFQGPTVCHNVTVTPIPPTILPPVKVCPEDTPYTLPWGDDAYASGAYTNTISSYQGCDSLLSKTVTVLPVNSHTLSPIGMCQGNCITVCNEQFCDFGTFIGHCKSAAGCDSTVIFTILDADPVVDIQDGAGLTCINLKDTLHSAITSGFKTWLNSTGQQIGTGNTLVVQSPGTYFLSVTRSLNGAVCTKTDSIVVTQNITPPSVNATGGMIGCDTVPLHIHANAGVSPAQFNWSGPAGFSSMLPNPVVTGAGAYIVTVVNPANGCSKKDTAFVTICCHNFAGTLDTTPFLLCGDKTLQAFHHGDQYVGIGDSLIFILYADPLNPFGSVVEYSDMPVFPFVPGITQFQIQYYVAAVTGKVLPDHTISFSDTCLSVAPGPPVEWFPKPVMIVLSAPNVVCKGDCLDVTFNFTGTPPFQFFYEITQNGQMVYARNETSDALSKTITVCPADFNPPGAGGNADFKVNFFRDVFCTCSD